MSILGPERVSLRTTSICVVEANGSAVCEGKAESEPAMLIKALIGWRNEACFAFHYDYIMRVNVVWQAWTITHPDNTLMRSFYDSSLWESIRLEGDHKQTP